MSEDGASLIAMSGPADKLPLFVVHGAGGGILFLREFAAELSGVRQVFGLRGFSLHEPSRWDPTIDSMVVRYAREVTAAHPGPYLLGGYSSGGTIALEMARAIQAAGGEVALVILFESWPTGDATQPRLMRHLRLVRYLITDGYGPVSGWLNHVSGSRIARLRRLVSRSPAPDVTPDARPQPEPERDDVDGFFRRMLELLRDFEFGAYDVETVLLKADVYWPHLPRDYGWQKLLSRPLEMHIVPGHHITMWWPEHAKNLAMTVDGLLDRIDLRASNG